MSEADGGGVVVCSKDPSGAPVSPSEDATDAAACGPRSEETGRPLSGKTKGGHPDDEKKAPHKTPHSGEEDDLHKNGILFLKVI
jgi:hypothetical protein